MELNSSVKLMLKLIPYQRLAPQSQTLTCLGCSRLQDRQILNPAFVADCRAADGANQQAGNNRRNARGRDRSCIDLVKRALGIALD